MSTYDYQLAQERAEPARLRAECERLRVALQSLVGYDSYQSEYDGQMLTLCPACGEQDGNHSKTCNFVAARAALTPGAPA